MKRMILRVFALGALVLLGLFAIAQAQRNGQDRATAPPVLSNPLQAAEEPAEPNPAPIAVQANPLRPPAGEPAPLVAPPGEPPTGVNPLRSPPVETPLPQGPPDPFGLRRGNSNHPIRPAAYEEASRVDTRPAVASGPSLGGDRYASPAPADRRELPPAPEMIPVREPARLKAEPSAMPTNLAASAVAVRPENGPRLDEPAPGGQPPSDEGTGQPGSQQLEGPQTPQLTIQKLAPREIQVGKPATLRITVRNTGSIPAGNVEVHDQVPRGTRLVAATPNTSPGPRGELVWTIGTLKPGDESSVEMQLMPTAEGELGSVATVRFDAAATARSTSTRPRLVVETLGPAQVLIGDDVALTFTVSNPGSGAATGVVLTERIPAGLQHPAGSELEYTVGDLKPGESRKLTLKLKAAQPGSVTNVIVARGDGSLRAEHRFGVEVASPQLNIAMAGPKRRYLEREATYQVSISNPGTAPAEQVELAAFLPPGLKYVSANNAGRYDEATRAVYWRLEELPVNQKGIVELATLPVEPGQQNIKLRVSARRGVSVEKEQPVLIEGIAAVLFQVVSMKNPIEVGGETPYEIRVVNQGSKAAGNVRVAVFLPPEMKPLSAEGPTRHVIENNQVLFDGLAQLAPKADVTYRVRAQGLRPGDLRVRCQLLTDEMQSPVTKEESTQVYADQ